jgi:hypothetical protein
MNNKANKTSFKKGHKGYKSWLGKKFSIEHTEKLSKPKTKEHKEKLSQAKLGKKGKLANNWQGGIAYKNGLIRTSIEQRLWCEAVFARDGWTCQKSGQIGGKLHAHHIKGFSQYPELRLAIDNGITLSIKAHREFHKIYGYKNNTLEQILEFINNKCG